MRVICLLLLGASAFAAPAAQRLPKAPLRFEPNQGQAGSALAWTARGPGYSIGFTNDATLFQVGERTVAMRLPGQDATAPFVSVHQFPVSSNYILARFQGSVPAYARLRRNHIYPGIDIVYYGSGDNLEYDFEIAPGADPSPIRIRFDGADQLHLAANGDLLVELGSKTLTQHVPVVYQTGASGEHVAVPARYQIAANREVTVKLGRYDSNAPLVIDPSIYFAIYPKGSGADSGMAIARDAKGFVYVAGNTTSTDYPLLNAAIEINRGGQDVFVLKLNPDANTPDEVVQYATYYGGDGTDLVKAMAVDPTGLIYLAGSTNSTDLILKPNAYKTTNAGSTDALVIFLDPARSGSLTLVYATFLGGKFFDEATAITYFDGMIYVTGGTVSDDFPVVRAYQPVRAPGRDMFVAQIDPNQSGTASLVACTFFGGVGADYARSLVVDAPGHVLVAGTTYSPDFPLSFNAYQSTYSGSGDGFITEFHMSSSSGGYSTFLGGSGIDDIRKMVVDPSGRLAVAGFTSSANFPITQNAYQSVLGGPGAINSFLTILNIRAEAKSDVVAYSTFYGGSVGEIAWDLALGQNGMYYLGGYSLSPDLPVSQNALNPVSAYGGLNGFVAAIDPSAPPLNALTYGSYITGPGSQAVYGVTTDEFGRIYVTGFATGDIFPAGSQQHDRPGDSDTFVLIFWP